MHGFGLGVGGKVCEDNLEFYTFNRNNNLIYSFLTSSDKTLFPRWRSCSGSAGEGPINSAWRGDSESACV